MVPLVVVLAAAAVAVAGFVVLSGDENSDSDSASPAPDDASPATDDGPAEVVTRFFEATVAEDCETLLELTASSSQAGLTPEQARNSCELAMQERAPYEAELVSVRVVSENEFTATVATEVREGDDIQSDEAVLVREDSSWKIDFGALRGE